MAKLGLKPFKPYKFRVILCDDQGNQVNDDVTHIEQAVVMMESLAKELVQKQDRRRKGGGEK